MDKQIKQSILILGVLIVLSVAFAIVFYLQKQNAETHVASLTSEVADYEAKSTEYQKKIKSLQDESARIKKDLDARNADNADLSRKVDAAKNDAEQLSRDLDKARKSGDALDGKIENLRRERDDLIKQVTELKNRPEKVVEKIVYRDNPAAAAGATADAAATGSLPAGETPVAGSPEGVTPGQAVKDMFASVAGSSSETAGRENEKYWAAVVREKAALELEVQKVKTQLSDSTLQITELKKSNSDLENELGRIKNEKEAIIRKIKYGEDLADNISVELARARNEQKLSQDRSDELLAENQKLRLDIKQLTTTKVALEKSIAGLSEEKASIEKKLSETESVIQSRVDEMWQIKKDIDTRFGTNGAKNTQAAGDRSSSGEVELAPIVVSGKKGGRKAASQSAGAISASRKFQGSVVSVNEENNFIIVSLGEKTGIRVGDTLSVYHNGAQIGSVEIIQVRQDISAADIKQKIAPFSVGDTVR